MQRVKCREQTVESIVFQLDHLVAGWCVTTQMVFPWRQHLSGSSLQALSRSITPSGVMPPKTPMKRAMKAGGAMKAQSKSQKLLQAADEIDAFVSSRAKKEDKS